MCGRFTYLYTWKQLQRLMNLLKCPPSELVPRYNVAPSQMAPVIRQSKEGARRGVLMRWGLPPVVDGGNELIIARSETVDVKSSFREAFRHRRCLVLINGFYEWQRDGSGRKQPFWIGRADQEAFAVAGVWDSRQRGDETIESFAILTTQSNQLMSPIHDRMPVILDADLWDRWLDHSNYDPVMLKAMLRSRDHDGLVAHPVSARVNHAHVKGALNDDPSLIVPINPDFPGLFNQS